MGSLPPETTDKLVALERRAVRGGWTIGRESAAIRELRALVARLGHPVRGTEAREAPAAAPPWLVVVQRRELGLAEQLRALARPDVPVIWDRRASDRRASAAGPVLLDRRRRNRRETPPATWSTLRFLVVPTGPTS